MAFLLVQVTVQVLVQVLLRVRAIELLPGAGESLGDGGVSGRVLGISRDCEAPAEVVGRAVARAVADPGGEARGVGRSGLERDAIRKQAEGAGADLINPGRYGGAARVAEGQAARVDAPY